MIIGVDPHKATHTAVAIGDDEGELGTIKVRATRKQVPQLLAWAEPFEKRTWAIESAAGLGYLLAQQLVDAGETVVDVPATLASRVRLLGSGRSDKNDPNDARSVAVAALRAPSLREVQAVDHGEVLRLLAKRNLDIGSHRTRVVCRLDAAIAGPTPGGTAKELNGSDADAFLELVTPMTPVEHVRLELARELLVDVRRRRAAQGVSRSHLAVTASKTTLTDIFGVGPISRRCSPAPRDIQVRRRARTAGSRRLWRRRRPGPPAPAFPCLDTHQRRYVYRAVDQHGQVIDVVVSNQRDPPSELRACPGKRRT